jgi:hypothetical protein
MPLQDAYKAIMKRSVGFWMPFGLVMGMLSGNFGSLCKSKITRIKTVPETKMAVVDGRIDVVFFNMI